MTYSAKLYNPQQAHQILRDLWPEIKARVTAGHRLTLTIQREAKSRSQEKKYHSMIGEITRAMRQAGSQWDEADWKRLLIDQWAHDHKQSGGRVVPSLDGSRVVQLGIQSRNFNVEHASSFIEWLHAWAAEKGIELCQ